MEKGSFAGRRVPESAEPMECLPKCPSTFVSTTTSTLSSRSAEAFLVGRRRRREGRRRRRAKSSRLTSRGTHKKCGWQRGAAKMECHMPSIPRSSPPFHTEFLSIRPGEASQPAGQKGTKAIDANCDNGDDILFGGRRRKDRAFRKNSPLVRATVI